MGKISNLSNEERLEFGKEIARVFNQGVTWANIGSQFRISHATAKKLKKEYDKTIVKHIKKCDNIVNVAVKNSTEVDDYYAKFKHRELNPGEASMINSCRTEWKNDEIMKLRGLFS